MKVPELIDKYKKASYPKEVLEAEGLTTPEEKPVIAEPEAIPEMPPVGDISPKIGEYNVPFVVSDTPVNNELVAQDLEASISAGFFEEMGARFVESWVRAPSHALMRWTELRASKYGIDEDWYEDDDYWEAHPDPEDIERLDKEEWEAGEYYREELSFDEMKGKDGKVVTAAAKIIAERKDKEILRQKVLARSPGGIIRGGAGFATDFIAQAVDPINLASAFIPIMGPVRYASWAKAVGVTVKGKTAIRLGSGAIEGVVGNAIVEPVVYFASKEEQADYGMVDGLINVGMGAVIGAGAHAGLGKLMDIWELKSLKSRENAFKTAVTQTVEGKDVDISPIKEAARIEESARIKVRQPPETQKPGIPEITVEERSFAKTAEKYDLYEVDGTVIRDPETRRNIIVNKEIAIKEAKIRAKAAKEVEKVNKKYEKLWFASGKELEQKLGEPIDIPKLEKELADLKSRSAAKTTNIAELEKEIADMEKEFPDLKDRPDIKSTRIEKQKKEISKLEKELADLESRPDIKTMSLEELEKELAKLKKEVKTVDPFANTVEIVEKVNKISKKLWFASGKGILKTKKTIELQKKLDIINKKAEKDIAELQKKMGKKIKLEPVVELPPDGFGVMRDFETGKEIIDPEVRQTMVKDAEEAQRKQAKRDWKDQNKADLSELVAEEEMVAKINDNGQKYGLTEPQIKAIIKVLTNENLTKRELNILHRYNKALTDLNETSVLPAVEGHPDTHGKKIYNDRKEEIRSNVINTHQDLFLKVGEFEKRIERAKQELKQLQEGILEEREVVDVDKDIFGIDAAALKKQTMVEDTSVITREIDDLAEDFDNKATIARERQKGREIEDKRLRATETPQETKARRDSQAPERLEDNRIIEVDNEAKSDAVTIENAQDTYSKAIDIARHCVRR